MSLIKMRVFRFTYRNGEGQKDTSIAQRDADVAYRLFRREHKTADLIKLEEAGEVNVEDWK